MLASRDIARLIEIMAALRQPGSGCPWDLQQDSASIAPYVIEEAYEVVDAIERGDMADLVDELGDLLLQVVFHAQMASEQAMFDFGDVVTAITAKMIRRHPHVFGDARDLSPAAVKQLWGSIKGQEKAARLGNVAGAKTLLADIPTTLPGLTRAVKLQAKASTIGFDWNDPRQVLAKIREEADEIEAALDAGEPAAIQDEIGDLFFALANLARHIHVDPETCVRGANAKFERRFGFIEQELARRGDSLAGATLEAMEALWQQAKGFERLVVKGN